MGFKSKYIIMDAGVSEVPLVFTELLTHSDVARGIRLGGKVYGAGFCYIQDNKYVCYGESVSLQVKSRGDIDSKILNKLLGANDEG